MEDSSLSSTNTNKSSSPTTSSSTPSLFQSADSRKLELLEQRMMARGQSDTVFNTPRLDSERTEHVNNDPEANSDSDEVSISIDGRRSLSSCRKNVEVIRCCVILW